MVQMYYLFLKYVAVKTNLTLCQYVLFSHELPVIK